MQLEEHAVGDVVVLLPSGRLTRNESFGDVNKRLRDLVQQGSRKFVLDLGAVSYMDSTCIGELVSGFVTVRKHGGTLHLANPTSRVEHLLSVAGLTSIFGPFGSQEDVVRRVTDAR
ncbi:MAG: STAS domain-containing protein [Acidobacteriota bacterium]|nr:STAS domain-containing protein [Acidobacteriota bacterium]